MKKELLKGLLLKLAKEEGIDLTDEQLSAISGGGCSYLVIKAKHVNPCLLGEQRTWAI